MMYSYTTLFTLYIYSVVISIFSAALLTILVEQPFSGLCSLVFGGRVSSSSNSNK